MGCCYSSPEEEHPVAVAIYSIAPAQWPAQAPAQAPAQWPAPSAPPIAYARYDPQQQSQTYAQHQLYDQQIGYQVQQPEIAQKPHSYPSAIPVL